jgi:hypothetical protein
MSAATLKDAAALIRSKNAGPFWLTIDVMFHDDQGYRRALAGKAITPERMASIFGLPVDEVLVFNHDVARAIKISFPRLVSSGSARDNDVFGGQQYAPLLDLPLDGEAGGADE